MTPRGKAPFLIAALAVLGMVVVPSSALGATTVGYDSGANKITVDTTDGESNDIGIAQAGDTYTFTEVGTNDASTLPIAVAGDGGSCLEIDLQQVDCTASGVVAIDVSLGSGDGVDLLDAEADPSFPLQTKLTVDGGAGDDDVIGGEGDDSLSGGTGNDEFDGAGGNDVFAADASTDGDDSFTGSDGTDAADYSARSSSVNLSNDFVSNDGGAGEADDISFDVEMLIGGSGADTLTGEGEDPAVPNILRGNAGIDNLVGSSDLDTADYANSTSPLTVDLSKTVAQNTGGAGIDTLTGIENVVGGGAGDTLTGSAAVNEIFGGDGADSIRSRDLVADQVDCGNQVDKLVSDTLDEATACESIDDGSPAGLPPDDDDDASATDRTAPKLAVISRSLRMSKKGTIKVTVSCPDDENDPCDGEVRLAGKSQVGNARFSGIDPGERAAVKVKLSSKARKQIRSKKKLKTKVIITARDDAGNVGKTVAKLVIKK